MLHHLEHLSHPSGRDLCFRMREVPDLGIAGIPSANGIGGPVEAVGDGGGTSLEPRWLEGVGWWVDSFWRSACVAATMATILAVAILAVSDHSAGH